jgi:beta-mannosidase
MRNWIAHLNGKRLFLKGNNYPPGDTRLARMNYEAYQRDLRLAKEAHMNMLRVHAHVEHPAFYEAADEVGILLWQDFPLQWHYRKEVLPQALRQVERMIGLLFNHPSLVIWCMHNEPLWIAETTEALAGRRRFLRWNFLRMLWSLFVYSWDREMLDSRLKGQAMRLDPTRFVVRSSGEWALGPWRGGTDGHHYHGWYPASGPRRAFDNFRRRSPKNIRFVTEFGAQSFPNYESSIKFMDPDLERIDWRHLEERHSLQWGNMQHWIDVEAYEELPQLIEASQDYQTQVNRFFIDRLRFHKYRPTGGVLAFLFLDSNPAVQWSVIDYWRVPKRSYYALKHAFHPQYVFTLLEKDVFKVGEEIGVSIYIVNDSQDNYDQVEVIAEVFNAQSVRTLHASFPSSLEADSEAKLVQNLTLRFPSPGERRLVLTLRYGEEEFQNEYRLPIEG